jgi:hypothetical protein
VDLSSTVASSSSTNSEAFVSASLSSGRPEGQPRSSRSSGGHGSGIFFFFRLVEGEPAIINKKVT